jgi:hypothetical protein
MGEITGYRHTSNERSAYPKVGLVGVYVIASISYRLSKIGIPLSHYSRFHFFILVQSLQSNVSD